MGEREEIGPAPTQRRAAAASNEGMAVAPVQQGAIGRLAESNNKFGTLSGEAKIAADQEQSMTVLEAIKLYPKAIAWSVIFSSAIAMEGFDLVLISAFFAFPPFTERYGVLGKSGSYQIPAPWQAALGNGARIGEILGLLLNGWLCERYGFRWTMIGSLLLLIGLIFIQFFAQNIEMLFVGALLLGFPWGVFQTITTAYASEVCPVRLRPFLTTYVNMMWGVGQLVATGVLRAMLTRGDQWAYRIPFALQWAWALPILVGCLFMPESPWWLVRRGRDEEARASLKRLSMNSEQELETTVAMMRHTDDVEKEISAGTSYLDCFRGINARRTEIVSVVWVIQAASGASLMGFSAYFFQQAGLPTTTSFDFSMALYSVAIIGVWISWFTMSRFGRRTLYIYGLGAMTLALLGLGFSSLGAGQASSYASGSLLLVYTLCYDVTVGTIAYSIVTEMPSSRLRTKTMAIARSLYNVQGIINGVITPYMLNPNYWNWKAKAGFFWAGMALICLTWAYFRLPEPRNRTFAEMDLLFEQKISARKFHKTKVDPFLAQHEELTSQA